ncbi:hypothetical protein PVAND_002268 [Polypedilum vanderplanki]|uniref:DNA-directed RNA polymerase III subunit RPC8 n=1 Tax=Polypedilum vanderplanki TaxID=319348 RepID=A0A9J6BQG2_POLVA|nr:hypothetical protein PVAND_002268 [Polypedilum vanderplanki]
MFVITEINSTVVIQPKDFNKKVDEVCKYELNRKLANKILHNVGLCLYIHEIVFIGDALVKPTDGYVCTQVVFRVVVFRPELGSILTGTVRKCERNGIYVSLGFFDDIFIPENKLQFPSRYDEVENVWVWQYSVGNDETHDLFIDEGEKIKLRVVDEYFFEHEPVGSSEEIQQEQEPSYIIIGSINECGLGLDAWWNQAANNENDEEY